MSASYIIVTLFACSLMLIAQDSATSQAPVLLTLLSENFESAVARAEAPIRTAYISELQKLKTEYIQAGDLQNAVAVDKVLATNQSADTPKAPERMKRLSENFESEVARVVAPIRKVYCNELQKLKINYTKAGALQDALAVDKVLVSNQSPNTPLPTLPRKTSNTPVPTLLGKTPNSPGTTLLGKNPKQLKEILTDDDFTKWLANTKWSHGSGVGISFNNDGKRVVIVNAANKGEGPGYAITVLKIGTIEFQWGSGPKAQIVISDDLRTCLYYNRTYKRTSP